MRKTIPQIRERIEELTQESLRLAQRQQRIAHEIAALAQETRRRSYTRAPVQSRRVTQSVRRSIVAMAAGNPGMTHQDIAVAHDVNIGRVSEILHGPRG